MTEEEYAKHPIVRDSRAYVQTFHMVTDERCVSVHRDCRFLTPTEERWYNETIEKYRKEFGFALQENP